MSRLLQIFSVLFVFIAVVGCGKDVDDSKTPEDVKTAVTKPVDEESLDELLGTWLMYQEQELISMITIDVNNKSLSMKQNDIVYEYNIENIEEDKIDTLLVKSVGGSNPEPTQFNDIKYSFSLNGDNQLKVVTEDDEENEEWKSLLGTKLIGVSDSGYKDISDQLVGEWVNDSGYITIAKRDGNLVLGLEDGEAELVFKIGGSANNVVAGTVIEGDGIEDDDDFTYLKDNNILFPFVLNADGSMSSLGETFTKTDSE